MGDTTPVKGTRDEIEEEKVLKELGKMRLTEDEKGGLVEVEDDDIDDTRKDMEKTMTCKILTPKEVIAEHFQRLMPKIWGIEGKVQIKKSGKNVFICKFKSRKAKKRLVDNDLWIYDKAVLIFDELKGDKEISSLEFRYVSFWFHFHKLPVVCMNRKYAAALANSVGTFVKSEEEEEGRFSGESLRVKVKVDVTKPLRRLTRIKVGVYG